MIPFVYLSSIFALIAYLVLKYVKITQPKQATMGTWLSYLWWGCDPDAVDLVSGLSKRDIYTVQKTWAVANKDAMATGTELLRRLFAAYPDIRDFFKMVRKLPEAEYVHNPQFRAHVINLMTSLTLAVNNLHQPEVVAAMMNKLGESHKRRRIKEQHFHELKKVIVQLFIDALKLDNDALGSWSRTVDFMYKHIFVTLNEAEEETR